MVLRTPWASFATAVAAARPAPSNDFLDRRVHELGRDCGRRRRRVERQPARPASEAGSSRSSRRRNRSRAVARRLLIVPTGQRRTWAASS